MSWRDRRVEDYGATSRNDDPSTPWWSWILLGLSVLLNIFLFFVVNGYSSLNNDVAAEAIRLQAEVEILEREVQNFRQKSSTLELELLELREELADRNSPSLP